MSSARPRWIVVTYHKVMTVLMGRVFRTIAADQGLSFERSRRARTVLDVDLYLDAHGEVVPAQWPAVRGIQLRRDPRDVVVSGYFYHLRCEEAWCLKPNPAFAGRSYQEELRRRSREEGLLFELEHSAARTIAAMLAWDYHAPNFLPLTYESFMADYEGTFARAFAFLELEVERCLALARPFSFAAVTGRQPGEIDPSSHLRSGKPGQWHEHFTPDLLAAFAGRFPDALERLHYDPA